LFFDRADGAPAGSGGMIPNVMFDGW